MSTAPINVRLDYRRLEQLKAIGAVMGLSNAAVISTMIREKIAAGIIPATIPGTTVSKSHNGIALGVTENETKTFSREAALSLANTIRGVVSGTEAPTMINLDHGFTVNKQGTGLRIVLSETNSAAFPPDLALDLADLIEKVAA